MIFNNGSEKIKIFFVQQHHLDLFKGKGIPLSDLDNLLFYRGITESDLLDWISYQRSTEKKFFNNKYTTYSVLGGIKHQGVSHDKDILYPKLENIYKEDKLYEYYNNFCWRHFNNTIIILDTNNIVHDDVFIESFDNIYKALYTGLIKSLGYFKLYFQDMNEEKNNKGIGLKEIIYHCLKK